MPSRWRDRARGVGLSCALLAACAVPKQPPASPGAAAVEVKWTLRLESTGSARIDGVAALPGGGAAMAGTFSGTLTLGDRQLTSAGETDLFVAVVDSAGEPAWAERLGGPGADFARGLAASDTAIAVAGGLARAGLSGKAQGDRAPSGETAGLLVRVDRASKAISTTRLSASDYAVLDAVTMAGGRTIATGYFSGTLVAGDRSLVSVGASDVVTAAFEKDGTVAWAQSGGGRGADLGLAVAAAGDRVFIAGVSSPRARLGRSQLGDRKAGGFVAAMSNAGDIDWARHAPSDALGGFADIAASGDGLVAAGRISGSLRHGDEAITAEGPTDGALLAYAQTGDPRWAQTIAGPGLDAAIAIDAAAGAITAAGEVDGKARVLGRRVLEPDDRDIVIVRLDPSGELRWLFVIGGLGRDLVTDIATLPDGSVLVSGNAPTHGGPFLLRVARK